MVWTVLLGIWSLWPWVVVGIVPGTSSLHIQPAARIRLHQPSGIAAYQPPWARDRARNTDRVQGNRRWAIRVLIGVRPGLFGGVHQETAQAPRIYGEPVHLMSDYAVGLGPMFGLGVTYRLRSRWSVQLEFEWNTAAASADFMADIPHPFRPGSPRTVRGTAEDLTYREWGGLVSVGYRLHTGSAGGIETQFGLSVHRVRLDAIGNLRLQEQAYPYTTPPQVVGVQAAAATGVRFGGFFGLAWYRQIRARWGIEFQPRLLVQLGSLKGPVGERVRAGTISLRLFTALRYTW